MEYEVRIGKTALKRIMKAPVCVQMLLRELALDLREKGTVLVEVYYAGSREDAPY
jgi:hypothetical protein